MRHRCPNDTRRDLCTVDNRKIFLSHYIDMNNICKASSLFDCSKKQSIHSYIYLIEYIEVPLRQVQMNTTAKDLLHTCQIPMRHEI